MEYFIRYYQDGGVWMHPIAIASAFAFAIILERAWFYYVHCRVNAKALLTEVTKLIRNGEAEKARKLCASMKNPLSLILEAAIWHFLQNESEQEIQNGVDEVGLRELPRIQRRTHYLSLFANISTLGGLLGTIFGLQDAFTSIATADPAQKAVVLARGINIALNTTSMGLIVAIPCMVAYSMLGAKSNTIIEEIDESSVRLMNFLFSLRKN